MCAQISIKIKNQARILSAFKEAPSIFASEITKTMGQIGAIAESKVKGHIVMGTDMWKRPIDTWNMYGGIKYRQKDPLTVIIAPNLNSAPYAVYVHEGTRKMRARPFLDITAKREKDYIGKVMQKALDNIVNIIAKKTG